MKDAATGEDLIGATVSIKGTATGAVTNVYGFYSLSVPNGKITLLIKYLGYVTQEKAIEVAANQSITFQLASEQNELDEVVITAEAEDQNVKSVEMSVSRIDAAQIKQMPVVLGESDLVKSIQLLPGVSSVADGAAGFNVRGGSADQNLILLDEATLYNASHLLGFFSVFNTDAVKDVTLYKGGIPAIYGSRLSSVLDVRQKDGNNQKFNGEAGIGLISARALIEGPIAKGKSSYMIAGRRSYGDAILSLLGNDNTAYFYDINAKVNYTFNEKNRLFLSGYLGRDQFEIGSIFSNAWGNATGTLRWNHLFSDKLFSNFSLITTRYDYSIDILSAGREFNWQSDIATQTAKAGFLLLPQR